MNTNAECGSDEDLYYYYPWRSPGVAPVIDACGAAGGRLAGQGPGSAGADYQETVFAKRGDVGSKLPPRPSGTVWTAGEVVEVSWTQKAFHGGGCVVSRPLRFCLRASQYLRAAQQCTVHAIVFVAAVVHTRASEAPRHCLISLCSCIILATGARR